MGRFRAPTLRNVAVTAPYMHDGSVATLQDAIEHYATGGRASPFKSDRIRGFTISKSEMMNLADSFLAAAAKHGAIVKVATVIP